VERTELLTIADSKDFRKEVLQHIVIKDRVEAMLEDMNAEPVELRGELRIGDAPRRKHIFHASEIGRLTGKTLDKKYPMGCGRALYYGYVGAKSENSFDPRLRRIFDNGSGIHLQLQMYMHHYAKKHKKTDKFQDEVGISPENNAMADSYDISAHMDGLWEFTTPTIHARAGLEIKSINDEGFKATKGAHQEHIIQGTVYQACLDLPLMVFLYYNKNDSSLAEYVQVFDEDRWNSIKEKLDYVRGCAMKGTEPPQEITFGCRNCKYAAVCKPPKMGRGGPSALSTLRTSRKGQ
jgi:CRISPR/Cas system-associated exonuclease Cas4 (RecB family)